MKTKTIELKVTIDYPRRWRVGKVIGELEDIIQMTEDTATRVTDIGKLKPVDETNS